MSPFRQRPGGIPPTIVDAGPEPTSTFSRTVDPVNGKYRVGPFHRRHLAIGSPPSPGRPVHARVPLRYPVPCFSGAPCGYGCAKGVDRVDVVHDHARQRVGRAHGPPHHGGGAAAVSLRVQLLRRLAALRHGRRLQGMRHFAGHLCRYGGPVRTGVGRGHLPPVQGAVGGARGMGGGPVRGMPGPGYELVQPGARLFLHTAVLPRDDEPLAVLADRQP